MVNANDYISISDSDTLQAAVNSRGKDGIVVIPPRESSIDPERDYWLLDRAVLLPENTTVILQNCKIKLSDKCRDNFFRTANCGLGIEFPEKVSNIHIKGEGFCELVGADNPRATGDGSKILANPCPYELEDLCRFADWIPQERKAPDTIDFWDRHNHSFGTDAGNEAESQYGDWRGIGILFANVSNFSVSGIKITESHGWAISLEECSFGHIEKIEFNACMSKIVNGLRSNMENQDGIDIRNGCHHITISDISGETGDDVIALTAIADEQYHPGGSFKTTHVMHNDWSRRDRNIHDITIRNVTAYSDLCFTVRLLPANAKIWNVVIDGIIDTTPDNHTHGGTLLLGEGDAGYGVNPVDGMRNISVSNIICNADRGVIIGGFLSDSAISNVICTRPGTKALIIERENGINNVALHNIVEPAE